MKRIHKRILEKALPYYKKGREGDVKHIRWLLKTVPRFVDEDDADLDILIPVAILHDTGYSKVPKGSNPFNLNIRKLHSDEGAKIAEEILGELNYPKDKSNEIKRLILKHDNWALGDSFADEPILRIFNNFDFMWAASEDGFRVYQRIRGMNPEDTYAQIEKDREKNIEEGREWFNRKTGEFYNQLMKERKESLPCSEPAVQK